MGSSRGSPVLVSSIRRMRRARFTRSKRRPNTSLTRMPVYIPSQKMSRVAGTIDLRLDAAAPARQHLGRRGDPPPHARVVAPAPGEPQLHGVAQAVVVDARPAVHRAEQRDRVIAGRPAMPPGNEVEARLDVPAADGVERSRQPVAEAVAQLAAVEPLGAGLAVGTAARRAAEPRTAMHRHGPRQRAPTGRTGHLSPTGIAAEDRETPIANGEQARERPRGRPRFGCLHSPAARRSTHS